LLVLASFLLFDHFYMRPILIYALIATLFYEIY
jgi:hypothetical protein